MTELNQLLIIEAGDSLPPLLLHHKSLLEPFSTQPIITCSLQEPLPANNFEEHQLILLHSDLTTSEHLRQFVQLQSQFPLSSIIIVSCQQDEELCLLALEAGADDSIKEDQLTPSFIRKSILLSRRRSYSQKEIARSREQLLACIENAPHVAVQWYNSSGEVVFWNRASERIFGWTAKEAVGKNISELILIPDNRDFWLHKIHHLLSNPDIAETREWKFQYRDGTDGWCISTLMTIPSLDSGRWIVCMDIEITGRKKMEIEARENEQKYRSLIEQQADAITIFNLQGKILDVNSSATDLLQYSKEELKQMHLADVLVKQDPPIAFDDLAKGHATIKQRKMRRKDGSTIETEVHAKHLWDGQFLASVRNLTERMDVQHQLQKEIGLSNSIINSLPGLFYLFTKEGKYLRWNKQQEIISEYSAYEISNMGPLDFFDTKEKVAVQQAINETFENGHSFIEANLLTKSGKEVPFYFTGIAVDYADTTCLLGTANNLSPLKNLQKELTQQKIAAQKKVMQAMIDAEEKERAKLGSELHDNVNQILSVVRMYLSILNSDQALEGITLEQTMHLVDKAINEIRDLSHSLAVSYKFEAGLAEALQDLVEKIKFTRDFSIEMTIPPGLDDYITETQKLAIYRIVQEQMTNVIKHAKATKVELKITLTVTELLLVLTDNGKGFNTAITQKGLGLNNITNRTEALEGKLAIQSKPGKGCQIMVTIPLLH